MSKNRKRHQESNETVTANANWPSWFIETIHPLEKEMLLRVLQSNKHLGEIHFTVYMMQINYIVFRKNYEELVNLERKFNQPLNFTELAFQTDTGNEIAQETIIEFTRLLHNFFGLLKTEFYRNQSFTSVENFKIELAKSIEYYNHRRNKNKLKGLSPVQFRTQSCLSSY